MDRMDTLEKKFDEVQKASKPIQEPGRSSQPINDPSKHSRWLVSLALAALERALALALEIDIFLHICIAIICPYFLQVFFAQKSLKLFNQFNKPSGMDFSLANKFILVEEFICWMQ